MNLRRLWEPLDGIEATLSEHNEAAAFARFAWFVLALIILMFLLVVNNCKHTWSIVTEAETVGIGK